MRGHESLSNEDLRVTLKDLVESEIELSDIIADFSISGHEKAHFKFLEYYLETLKSVGLIMQMIRMRLSIDDPEFK